MTLSGNEDSTSRIRGVRREGEEREGGVEREGEGGKEERRLKETRSGDKFLTEDVKEKKLRGRSKSQVMEE